jgi:hypothetical protein
MAIFEIPANPQRKSPTRPETRPARRQRLRVSMPSTVLRRDRPHRLPSFAAIARAADLLAGGPIRDGLQAHPRCRPRWRSSHRPRSPRRCCMGRAATVSARSFRVDSETSPDRPSGKSSEGSSWRLLGLSERQRRAACCQRDPDRRQTPSRLRSRRRRSTRVHAKAALRGCRQSGWMVDDAPVSRD